MREQESEVHRVGDGEFKEGVDFNFIVNANNLKIVNDHHRDNVLFGQLSGGPVHHKSRIHVRGLRGILVCVF